MSDQVKEIKPFKQVPFADENAMLSITGSEFVAIQNFLNVFNAPLEVLKSIFDRNLNQGNITIKYIQQDGTEISETEAAEFLKKAATFLNEKTPN